MPGVPGILGDLTFEDEAVTVRRELHCDLAVGRARVREVFGPLQAERHRERVLDREAGATRFGREVGVLGEAWKQRLVGRGNTPVRERDPVEKTDDTLRNRTDVVEHVGPERHRTERFTPLEVRARAVVLEDDPTVT